MKTAERVVWILISEAALVAAGAIAGGSLAVRSIPAGYDDLPPK